MIVWWIPLIMILLAPIVQIGLLLRRLKNVSFISTAVITLVMVTLGIFLSFMATLFSLHGFDLAGIKCATGAGFFVVVGSMFSITVIPLIGIVYYLIIYFKKRHTLRGIEN
jgi:hypothetical protein